MATIVAAVTKIKERSIEIETATLTVTLRPRSRNASQAEQYAQSKAFVWGTSVPESVMAQPPYTTFGDDPANDRAWRKYNKLEIAAQRAALDEALTMLEDADVVTRYADLAVRFSRKAGCSCGCSPGFVLGTRIHATFARWITGETIDLYVTVKSQAKPVAPTADILLDAFAV